MALRRPNVLLDRGPIVNRAFFHAQIPGGETSEKAAKEESRGERTA